ncbi:sulfotransferase [Defluviimonas salinarum]|uniref:Sulfotransferase n=1 Tax=Defluviimonas salinarum TaxID=2992147 RepID=A0ABT3JAT1_9RHOB|nr:sulfotransferase [Defluviimonas salinarum]
MIVEAVVSLLAVGAFAFALKGLAIVGVAREALNLAAAGVSAMLDQELDDLGKEVAVRRAGFGLIKSAFSIFWRFGLTLVAASVPIFGAELVGLASSVDVMNFMLQWEYILGLSILGVLLSEFIRRRRSPSVKEDASANRYSTADRLIHMIAFSHPKVLKTASRLEDALMPMTAEQTSFRPIFITSLARAGTTAVLNALYDLPSIATHTYRDMPFLTAPRLWNLLAGGSSRSVERRERAHGDGLEIDLESPEAFEEVVWQLCWPDKYGEAGIKCWDETDRENKSEQFLFHHMIKIINARLYKGEASSFQNARYCSKNNANIARISFLKAAFPNSQIVVPIRQPGAHAASLLRQHQNFCKLHDRDAFIRRYMRDIGHFEFGQLHKPILFPSVESNSYDRSSGNYWLQYWIHAFREILNYQETCIFVLQDDLRSSPQRAMEDLCVALGLHQSTLQFSGYFRSEPDQPMPGLFDQELYDEAETLYREMEAIAKRQSAGIKTPAQYL